MGVVLSLLAFLFALLAVAMCSDDDSEPEQPRARSSDLSAEVRFSGTQFLISNNDLFDWTDCEVEVNGGIVSDGFELRAPLIAAGQTYSVGAMNLTKSDGERFNPFSHKPKKITISCSTRSGNGFYVGGWD